MNEGLSLELLSVIGHTPVCVAINFISTAIYIKVVLIRDTT